MKNVILKNTDSLAMARAFARAAALASHAYDSLWQGFWLFPSAYAAAWRLSN